MNYGMKKVCKKDSLGRGFIKPHIFTAIALVIIAVALCLGCAVFSACGSKGNGEEGRRLQYVYDESNGGYIVSAVEEGSGDSVKIPSEFAGEKVVGVSCGIFADGTVSEYEFCSQVFFTDVNKLAGADISGKKLYADAGSIDGIRARLYECANDEAARENALALANGVVMCGLEDDEYYLSFNYDWQAYYACGGSVLSVFKGKSGTRFDIESYCDFYCVAHRNKAAISDLDWAYSRANGNILSDITVDGVTILNGYTLTANAVANVAYERVYRIYVHGGNDGGYDLTRVQPDFCFDELNGEILPFRYVTQSGAATFLDGVNLRSGFTLTWEYAVHNGFAGGEIKRLNGLSSALFKEDADLDVYPVWTANVPEVSVTCSAEDNCITYGDNVSFSAEISELEEGFTLVYRWVHNGKTVGSERSLNLVRPSLSGGYDGVYTVKVTVMDNGNACCETAADVTLKIEKRTVSVSWSQDELVYNGRIQTPSAEAFGVDSESIDLQITGGGVEAGRHGASAATASSDYVLDNADVNFTIFKAPLTVKVRDCSFVYGGQPSPNGADYFGFVEAEDASVLKGTLAYSFSYTSKQVGTYADGVIVGGLVADNYEIIYKSGSLTILPLQVELQWLGAENLVYNGGTHSVTAVALNKIAGDDLTVEISGGEVVNAGNYTAVVTLSGADCGNYALAERTLDFCVVKADLSVAVTVADTEYGETPSPFVTGNPGNGEVTYVFGNTPDCAESLTRLTVGAYYVLASVKETQNYKAANAVARFEVYPREVTLSWTNDEELIYDSHEKNVSASLSGVLAGDVVGVRVIGGNAVNAGSYTAEAELFGTDAHNYHLPQMHTCTYVIGKAVPGISAAAGGKFALPGFVAVGTALGELTQKLPQASVSGFWRWKDGDSGSVGKAGSNSFEATFIPEDLLNYEEVEIEVVVFAKKTGGFELMLGSPDGDPYEGGSEPYRLEWNGVITIIEYMITLNRSGSYDDVISVHAESADGSALNVQVDEENLNVQITEKGTYTITFECAGNDEYMSESIVVTVIVE